MANISNYRESAIAHYLLSTFRVFVSASTDVLLLALISTLYIPRVRLSFDRCPVTGTHHLISTFQGFISASIDVLLPALITTLHSNGSSQLRPMSCYRYSSLNLYILRLRLSFH
ncbi:hypothetical protein J6590_082414 [Homalodisca vitripennis]|nr:hypothetical protein J6590_082414 [Homalodisca vitripennis]